ncbi:hypothetical protein MBLNU230_g1429t1 [Neophaeotheca triangularis]
MIPDDENNNFDIFRDCLSTAIIEKLAPVNSKPSSRKRGGKGRKNEIKPAAPVVSAEEQQENDAAELADFIEYLAEETFTHLPASLRTLAYSTIQNEPSLNTHYPVPLPPPTVENLLKPLPPHIPETLTTSQILSTPDDLPDLLTPVLETYITTATSPAAAYTPSARPEGCEICDREHLPLTYHHLIPRQVQAKAVKRGWCADWELQKVAWLCRACHSFVHRVASNEVLAREFNDVEALLQREDVQKWAQWVGRVRWKSR